MVKKTVLPFKRDTSVKRHCIKKNIRYYDCAMCIHFYDLNIIYIFAANTINFFFVY